MASASVELDKYLHVYYEIGKCLKHWPCTFFPLHLLTVICMLVVDMSSFDKVVAKCPF